MNNLIKLAKIFSAMYQGYRLGDRDMMNELIIMADGVQKSKESLVLQDKKVEALLRKLLGWLLEQPMDSNIITSLLEAKIAEILLLDNSLTRLLESAIDNEMKEDDARQLIFQIIKELRDIETKNKFQTELKHLLRPFMFEGEMDISKEDWIKASELISARIADGGSNFDRAVVEKATNNDTQSIADVINQLKVETSAEGIMKTGLAGINEALYPDCGIRRGLMYMINALTNRGKSFGLAHMLASVPLYNKPVLRDKSRIPTVLLMSAEDSLGLIFKRMYELFVTAETGEKPDFFSATTDEVVTKIVEGFKKNGWNFVFFRVNPSHDNIYEIMQRTRDLEMKGHEIIVAAYDYLAMADLEGTVGESRSDKLQDLYRRARNFFTSRGSAFFTPHQLNPDAKKYIRESDDDSEIYFAREIGGKSMTEGCTKLTNEVDIEITFHVAKMSGDQNFFTYYVGKQRGEGSQESARFGIYPLDPKNGLVHDVNMDKKMFRKSLAHRSEADGGGSDFDAM